MKRMLTILLVMALVLGIMPIPALADSNEYQFDKYGMREGMMLKDKLGSGYDGSWVDFSKKSDVPLNKEWTITFSGEIIKSKIDGIVIEKGDNFIPVDIKMMGNNQATVKPVNSFESSSEYCLKIFLNNGKRYRMNFNTVEGTNKTAATYTSLSTVIGTIIDIKLSDVSKLKDVKNVRVNGYLIEQADYNIHSDRIEVILPTVSTELLSVEVEFNDGVRVIAIKDSRVDKSKLITAINLAKTTDTIGKTEESKLALTNAIKAAEVVKNNVNATQIEVDKAIEVIDKSIKELEDIKKEDIIKNNLNDFVNYQYNIFITKDLDKLSLHSKSYGYGIYSINPNSYSDISFKNLSGKYERLKFDIGMQGKGKTDLSVYDKDTKLLLKRETIDENSGMVNIEVNVSDVNNLEIKLNNYDRAYGETKVIIGEPYLEDIGAGDNPINIDPRESLLKFTGSEYGIYDAIDKDLLKIHDKSYNYGIYSFNPTSYSDINFKGLNEKYKSLEFDFGSEISAKVTIIDSDTKAVLNEFIYNESDGIVKKSVNIEYAINLKIKITPTSNNNKGKVIIGEPYLTSL